MKRIIYLMAILLLMFTGCKPKDTGEDQTILPPSFTVEIPDALKSDQEPEEKALTDTTQGARLYEYLRYFIHVGDNAAQIVQNIINKIHEYNLSQNVSFSYTGDDGRVKNVVVKSDVEFDGQQWEYGMQITDAELESNSDKGIAMEVFWNLYPVEGIAILKPSYIDQVNYGNWGEAMIKIQYSEANPYFYEKYMIVSATDLPMDTNRFAVKNLKMFVGQNSTYVDVYGNTQHPNAWLLIPDHKGYDWAFVASSFPTEGIALAQVGLPPDTLNESSRQVLLEDYSLYKVLKNEITQWYFEQNNAYPDSLLLEQYLTDAQGPAHFNTSGFIPSTLAINPMFRDLEDFILNLSPYNPYEIAHMNIYFALNLTQKK